MTVLKRGMIIDVNLEPTKGSETGKIRPCVVVTNDIYNERVPVIQVVPITEWSAKKAMINTNVEILPSPDNGLSKKSLADCLQTRPIDHRQRLIKIRGKLSKNKVEEINYSLRIVFELNL
ncbi:MazF [Desulfamplus magnetovallimortis]|uniref:mRNA interferase n=1 Tax=Desulfamplus magnetovallimortis TaxID=1246637 RepID=A0A1W1H7V0_9BACT|nr:type II toxin-antitoxin system PemK/MazF family toxin [Desulfamplus magnetovallimortis]SLM28523.1 MazF [Desulfamplus magnetovallimortis]